MPPQQESPPEKSARGFFTSQKKTLESKIFPIDAKIGGKIQRVHTPTNPPTPQPDSNQPPAIPGAQLQNEEKSTEQGSNKQESGKSAKCKEKERKPKKKRTPLVHTDEEIRSMLCTIRAETKLSFTAILRAALRAWHDKLAYLQPIRLKRLCSVSLRTLAGIVAEAEKCANQILRQIILARIDPVKKAELADKLDDEIVKLQSLRRTISREAGIPVTHSLTTDAKLAIVALEEKKQETTEKSVQDSYNNVIQVLKRYQLDTYELPEHFGDNNNLNP